MMEIKYLSRGSIPEFGLLSIFIYNFHNDA